LRGVSANPLVLRALGDYGLQDFVRQKGNNYISVIISHRLLVRLLAPCGNTRHIDGRENGLFSHFPDDISCTVFVVLPPLALLYPSSTVHRGAELAQVGVGRRLRTFADVGSAKATRAVHAHSEFA
jgi:hypothetical protein